MDGGEGSSRRRVRPHPPRDHCALLGVTSRHRRGLALPRARVLAAAARPSSYRSSPARPSPGDRERRQGSDRAPPRPREPPRTAPPAETEPHTIRSTHTRSRDQHATTRRHAGRLQTSARAARRERLVNGAPRASGGALPPTQGSLDCRATLDEATQLH